MIQYVAVNDVKSLIDSEINELQIMMKDDRSGAESYSHEIMALMILQKRLDTVQVYGGDLHG